MNFINQCENCILDNTVEDISFNEKGVCNYCEGYHDRKSKHSYSKADLEALVQRVKKPDQKYDCIVGISGGLDSSYLLHKAKQLGLNPLAVHCDSGWNSETASHNIEILTKKLNVDLYTYVVDWDEFKSLQKACLKAGVIDLEFPTDHVYLAALFFAADKYNIKTIFTGNNLWSEGIMPDCWIHNKGDSLNMTDIYKKQSKLKVLRHLPVLGLKRKFYYYNICRIKNIFLLNYLNYDRSAALKELQDVYNWQQHVTKHGETIYTRFYHRYILPKRFNIDIRKAHLSSLICCGQITKDEALNQLSQEIYPTEVMEADKKYILKKLDITEAEFGSMMNMKRVSHTAYRSETRLKIIYNRLRTLPLGFNYLLNISNHC